MVPSAAAWEAIMAAMTCLCASTKNGIDNNFIAGLTMELNHQYPNQTRLFITPEDLQEIQSRISYLQTAFIELNSHQAKLLAEIKKLKTPAFCPPSEANNQFIIRDIRPPEFEENLPVVCNGDWLVILMREGEGRTINFYRSWEDYKRGFGVRGGELFIGLEKLHILTKSKRYELMIRLTDFDNEERTALYDRFEIGSEAEGYPLKVLGSYSGDAGDSLSYHRGNKFTTFDRDNDKNNFGSCAEISAGAWWYGDEQCHESNLFGHYSAIPQQATGRGIIWNTFHGMDYSLKEAIMLIRPLKNCG